MPVRYDLLKWYVVRRIRANFQHFYHSTNRSKTKTWREAGSLPYRGWVVIQPAKFQFENLLMTTENAICCYGNGILDFGIV